MAQNFDKFHFDPKIFKKISLILSTGITVPINDYFPNEQLLALSVVSWYSDLVNYLVSDIIFLGMSYNKKKNFLWDVKQYFWEEPLLYKHCADGMIRMCARRGDLRNP